MGVAGTLVARAERYRVERQVWAWWLAEVSTMMSSPRARPPRPHATSRQLTTNTHGGKWFWPRYPRSSNGRVNHREALGYVLEGVVSPTSRWHLTDAA